MLLAAKSVMIGWKISLIVFSSIGLSTCLFSHQGFWSSYVLDIFGPAWVYILIRGNYSPSQSFLPLIKISPEVAVLFVLGTSFMIETSQYFQLYEAHYDPYDYIAYSSLVIPCYLVDRILINSAIKTKAL